MSKVFFPATVAGIIGRITTGVYYRSGSTKFGYLRSWVYPKLTNNNTLRGSEYKNLATIWGDASEEYKANFATYGQKYKDLPVYGNPYTERTASGFAIWLKAVYAWKESQPTTDLATLTTEDFELVAALVGTVKACVDNNFLPVVDGYETLTEAF